MLPSKASLKKLSLRSRCLTSWEYIQLPKFQVKREVIRAINAIESVACFTVGSAVTLIHFSNKLFKFKSIFNYYTASSPRRSRQNLTHKR